jgi:hypothetical protein
LFGGLEKIVGAVVEDLNVVSHNGSADVKKPCNVSVKMCNYGDVFKYLTNRSTIRVRGEGGG